MHSEALIDAPATGAPEEAAGSVRRILWLTWKDPAPERDGQRIYSGRLIAAVAAAGARVDVLCMAGEQARPAPAATPCNLRWHPIEVPLPPRWLSAISRLPNVAHRSGPRRMQAALRQSLSAIRWDLVVLEGLATGWALPMLLAIPPGRRPKIVHVSHNHEASTRHRVADDYRGNPLIRLALRRDAAKARRLENRMVAAADLVTAITPADAALYRIDHPGKRVEVLTPGFAGSRLPERHVDRSLPRLAVVVGSFRWIAKRMNLEAFVRVADPLFEAAAVRLQVVGDGEPALLDALQRDCRAVQLVGPVDDLTPYLRAARIAIVPELTGGGFKLKVLDYVFNRVPIFAMDGSVAGTPLRDEHSVRLFRSFQSLARAVVDTIDDTSALDRMQQQAFDLCDHRFDWAERGHRLAAAMDRL